jgi:hypothetical protein
MSLKVVGGIFGSDPTGSGLAQGTGGVPVTPKPAPPPPSVAAGQPGSPFGPYAKLAPAPAEPYNTNFSFEYGGVHYPSYYWFTQWGPQYAKAEPNTAHYPFMLRGYAYPSYAYMMAYGARDPVTGSATGYYPATVAPPAPAPPIKTTFASPVSPIIRSSLPGIAGSGSSIPPSIGWSVFTKEGQPTGEFVPIGTSLYEKFFSLPALGTEFKLERQGKTLFITTPAKSITRDWRYELTHPSWDIAQYASMQKALWPSQAQTSLLGTAFIFGGGPVISGVAKVAPWIASSAIGRSAIWAGLGGGVGALQSWLGGEDPFKGAAAGAMFAGGLSLGAESISGLKITQSLGRLLGITPSKATTFGKMGGDIFLVEEAEGLPGMKAMPVEEGKAFKTPEVLKIPAGDNFYEKVVMGQTETMPSKAIQYLRMSQMEGLGGLELDTQVEGIPAKFKTPYGPLGEADNLLNPPHYGYIYETAETVPRPPKGFQGGTMAELRRWAGGGLNYEQVMEDLSSPETLFRPAAAGRGAPYFREVVEPTFSASVQSFGKEATPYFRQIIEPTFSANVQPKISTRPFFGVFPLSGIIQIAKARPKIAFKEDMGLTAYLRNLTQFYIEPEESTIVIPRVAYGLQARQIERSALAIPPIYDFRPAKPTPVPYYPLYPTGGGGGSSSFVPAFTKIKSPFKAPKMKGGRWLYEEKFNPFNISLIPKQWRGI